MSRKIYLISLLFLLICTNLYAQDTTKIMNIRKQSDFEHANGQTVAVYGTYVILDGRKAEHEGSIPQAFRLAAVKLHDGAHVMLGGNMQAWNQRSEEEINQFEGKPVVATGLFIPQSTGGNEGLATIQAPCLFVVLGVFDPEIYRLLNGGELR
jgi:hypothetical protein